MQLRYACALAFACRSSGATVSLVEGGQLVSMSEGESRTLMISAPSTLGAGAPAWAQIANGGTELVLAPGCDAITGTDGPPEMFSLDVTPTAGGGAATTVLVQVHPSGAGPCQPTLAACMPPGISDCTNYTGLATDCTPATGLITNQTLDVDFISPATKPFADVTKNDEVVTFELVNPDPADVLDAKLSTDAPFSIPPRDPAHETSFCHVLPNREVIGTFNVSYVIARGDDGTAPTVAGGQFAMFWDTPQPYGVEIVWCANTTADCAVIRDGANICLQTSSDTTIGLRIWASPPANNQPYTANLTAGWLTGSAATPVLTSITNLGSGMLQLPISAAINATPLEVTATLGTPVMVEKLQITLQDSADATVPPFVLPLLVGQCP